MNRGRDIQVQCRCGEVHGRLLGASPATTNRVVCHCDDCQAFVHHLGRADLLDAHGGSDIVQVAPSSLRFERGMERFAGLRLTPKGLSRWYTRCCNTPLGNTLGPSLPFVGIAAQALGADARERDEVLGPPVAAILGKFAIGEAPAGSTSVNPWFLLRIARLLLGWKVRGQAWPHPFFDRPATPRYPITVLSREEREALRPLCGPKPA